MSNPQNINFWSGKNYMKRDSTSGTTTLAAPVTAMGAGGYFRTTAIIGHSLAVVPFCRVFYQPFKDGVIYPAQGNRLVGTVQKIDGTNNFGPICLATPTSTTLTIEIGFDANTLTGSYTVYYVLYKDYAL